MESESSDWQVRSALCICCRNAQSKDYNKDITTEYDWMGKREVYGEMISETFNLRISILKSEQGHRGVGLICEHCIFRLRDATEFKRQLLECEWIFNTYLNLATIVDHSEDALEDSAVTCPYVEIKLKNETDVKKEIEIYGENYVKLEDGINDHNHQFLKTCEGDNIEAAIWEVPLLKQPEDVPKRIELFKIKRNCQYNKSRKEVGPFICEICKKEFKKKQDLKIHITYHNTQPCLNTQTVSQSSNLYQKKLIHKEKPYVCDVCEKVFSRLDYFQRHMLIHTGKKPYQCDLCEKSFKHSSNLLNHKLIHTGEKPYKCDICKKAFSRTSYLSVHKLIHTKEKPYQCDICGKCFTVSFNLRQHKLSHTGEKHYQCDICYKYFSQSGYLRVHKLIHTGDKRHQCDLCKKGFTVSSDLQRHKLIHTKEKPHQCDVCGRCFSVSFNLQQHRLTHTGEKRHECDVCNKCFSRSDYLRKHKLIHTGEKPYQCDVCKRRFNDQSHFQRHRLIHTGEKRYQCDVCQKGFTRSTYLRQHTLIHTGK